MRPFRLPLLAAVILVPLVLSCSGWRDLSFTITFQDAKGLVPGDRVVRDDASIGHVRSVEITSEGSVRVGVRIDHQYRDRVPREARYVIEDSRARPSAKQITVHPRGGKATPVADGEVIEGSDGALRDLWKALGRAGDSTAKAAGRLAEDLREAIEETSDSPEARQLEKDLEELAEEAERVGRQGWDELRHQLPLIEEQVQRVREQLEKAGKSEQARELRKRFDRWREDVERHFDESS